MTLAHVEAAATADGLAVLGSFESGPEDGAPEGCGALVLLGPDGDRFWPVFRASPEARDGVADPLDRWSARVIRAIAEDLGAEAIFPFGGPPCTPFAAWALRSGRAWSSPVGMLVHAQFGLSVSFRGALAFTETYASTPAATKPCDDCTQPCLSACPVGALDAEGYDVTACHAYLDTAPGRDCLENGYAVRRSCPVGREMQDPRRAAFHMAAFHIPSFHDTPT